VRAHNRGAKNIGDNAHEGKVSDMFYRHGNMVRLPTGQPTLGARPTYILRVFVKCRGVPLHGGRVDLGSQLAQPSLYICDEVGMKYHHSAKRSLQQEVPVKGHNKEKGASCYAPKSWAGRLEAQV